MLNDNAFAQMNRLRTELEKVFGADLKSCGSAQVHPKVNIWDDADSFLLEAELPGVELQDVEIFVREGDQLSLKGERKHRDAEPKAWIRNERLKGKFLRTFKLPCSVDVEAVNANMKDGLLRIRLPKAASHQPRKIEIGTGE
ncbi:MAG: Hsp20/alpha crystallin family protein [Rubripirellula sp.]